MPTKDPTSPYNVKVLDRAVAILDCLLEAEDDLALPEISQRLELHKSTVHRLLQVLERHRFVEKEANNGRYGLGLKLFELGHVAVRRLGLPERAQPHLRRLAEETGETAHLCILEEGKVLYLEKVEGGQTIRVPSSVGRRNPAHCTAVGKALLADLPDEEVSRIAADGLPAFTKNTIRTLAALRRELAKVRKRGFAVDEEEIEEGLTCIGAPVRDASGRVVASISVAAPTFRLTKRTQPKVARLVVAAADALSRELGYRPRPARS